MGVTDPQRQVRVAFATVVLLGASITVGVALLPSVRFAYRLPALHVAIETAAAIIGLVAAYLVAGRFQRTRRLNDLLLALALTLLAGTNLAFGTVPAAIADSPTRFSTWAGVPGRVLGALGLVVAAFAPARTVVGGHRLKTVLAIPLALAVAAAVAVAALYAGVPAGVDIELAPESSGRPRLVGHPAVLAVQLLVMVLFAVAAAGFIRRAERDRDEFIAWLAAGVILGAFARLNYFLYPSLYSEWVYTGDAFRLLFYVTILVGAAREVRSYWQAAAAAAVLEERRRLARDLHDGLAQELAFIARNVRRLDRECPVVRRVELGAARALADSRRAIAALTESLDRPLDAALAEVARDVAAREGTEVALTLAPGSDGHAGAARGADPHRLRSDHERGAPRGRRSRPGPPRRRRRRGAAHRRRRARLRPRAPVAGRIRPHQHARARRDRRRPVPADLGPRSRDAGGGDPLTEPVRVVIADDHAPTREDVRAALEDDPGFAVVGEAPDAFGAIDAALRERPDLCLLDIHMPGGGVRAAWEISARLPQATIVMLTVSSEDRDLFAALQAGASGYLVKDMDFMRLPHALADVLQGRAALPRALVARLIEQFRDPSARRRAVVANPAEARLTSREWQILDLMRQELPTIEIARRLVLSPITVRTHVNSILKKLRAPDRETLLRQLNGP
jgi:DNA-binding NarL/FixJ family response regulator/signal transduction histidine kinase